MSCRWAEPAIRPNEEMDDSRWAEPAVISDEEHSEDEVGWSPKVILGHHNVTTTNTTPPPLPTLSTSSTIFLNITNPFTPHACSPITPVQLEWVDAEGRGIER